MRHEGRGPIPLDAYKQLLLPMVKHVQALHPNKIMTIECDVDNDRLLVRVQDPDNKRKIGFAISRPELMTRSYLTTFQPNVIGLLNALRLPQELYDEKYPPEKALETTGVVPRPPEPVQHRIDSHGAPDAKAVRGLPRREASEDDDPLRFV